MITAAILFIVVLTTITVALGTQPGTDLDIPATWSTPAVSPAKNRRRARRRSGIRRSVGLIRPQYLPALARARILRTQISYLGIATRRGRQMQ